MGSCENAFKIEGPKSLKLKGQTKCYLVNISLRFSKNYEANVYNNNTFRIHWRN